MDNRENATYKYIILAVAFMVTVVVTFISMNYETSAISTMTMTQATLPVVMMQTEEGQLYNRLYGYTQKVDASMMGETLTPLPTDKKLSVVVDLYGQELEGVSYDLVSGRYVIDAKSIMGIFSLDLSKPIDLNIHADSDVDTILAVLKPYMAN